MLMHQSTVNPSLPLGQLAFPSILVGLQQQYLFIYVTNAFAPKTYRLHFPGVAIIHA